MVIPKLERAIRFPCFRISMNAAFWVLLIAASGAFMVPSAARARSWLIQEPEEVVLTLSAEGFMPAEVTRGPGRFQLSVDNRSGVEQLTLNLKAADGTLLREMRIAPGSDWSELLDLTPGNYTLAEASHSNWVCVFIVRSTQEVVQMH